MAKDKIAAVELIVNEKELPKEIAPNIAPDGTFNEISFVEKSAFSHKVEEVMPVSLIQIKPIQSDDMFTVGDDVEVHGLVECAHEIIQGKIAKILGNYTYAVHGYAWARNKKLIGHNGPVARTYKAENLRKVTIRHEK